MKFLVLLFIAVSAHAYDSCQYVKEPCDAQGDHYSCFHAWMDGNYCAATDVSTRIPRPTPPTRPAPAPSPTPQPQPTPAPCKVTWSHGCD